MLSLRLCEPKRSCQNKVSRPRPNLHQPKRRRSPGQSLFFLIVILMNRFPNSEIEVGRKLANVIVVCLDKGERLGELMVERDWC